MWMLDRDREHSVRTLQLYLTPTEASALSDKLRSLLAVISENDRSRDASSLRTWSCSPRSGSTSKRRSLSERAEASVGVRYSWRVRTECSRSRSSIHMSGSFGRRRQTEGGYVAPRC